MPNCLAPAYVKVAYTGAGHTHVMTLPFSPSGSGGGILANKKGGGTISIQDAVDALVDLIKPLYNTADAFGVWEAFRQDDCDSAPVFQATGVCTTAAGTNGSSDVSWGQAVLTFRTDNGGRAKLTLMESVCPVNQHVLIATLGAGTLTDIAAYMVGSTSWVWGRDNSFLSGRLHYSTKINDVLRKKYLF